MKQQQGFTLVELIVVIVILGILAAVAVPKFVDMETDAYDAHAKAVAGSLASWSAMNYGKKKIGNGGTAITSTTDCATSLVTNNVAGDTTDITVVAPSTTKSCTAAGDTITCTVKHAKGTKDTATPSVVIGTPATLICTAAATAPSGG